MAFSDRTQHTLTDLNDAQIAWREAVRGGNPDEITFAKAMLDEARARSTRVERRKTVS